MKISGGPDLGRQLTLTAVVVVVLHIVVVVVLHITNILWVLW